MMNTESVIVLEYDELIQCHRPVFVKLTHDVLRAGYCKCRDNDLTGLALEPSSVKLCIELDHHQV